MFNYSHENGCHDEENRPGESVSQALGGNDDFLS